MKILAIESSCDETAVSVVEDGRTVLSNVISSQVEEHKLYGGVVPELASRRHCENIVAVTDKALSDAEVTLDDIDGIAVTYAPGLIGALLVGVNFAKGLSFTKKIPLIPVHHIRGHIAANYLQYKDLKPPFLCLVVSGGHSHIIEVLSYTDYKVIGRTYDDAVGEAYDKAARCLSFPYPGGVYIDKAAQLGNPHAYAFPNPKVKDSPYDFSFSGLKTAVINLIHNANQKSTPIDKNDLAASFQYTVCNILTSRLMAAAKEHGYRDIAVAGGVSANSGLRSALSTLCDNAGYNLYLPRLEYCTDNAAMIGAQGYYEYLAGNVTDMGLNAIASIPIG